MCAQIENVFSIFFGNCTNILLNVFDV